MTGSLEGKVAIVTGASRGIGKGTALGLGEAGATVYVTGRSVADGLSFGPGTVTETAQAVDAIGGRGIAVRCDHADDADVEALFRQVIREHGRLDLLVNNAFAQPASGMPANTPFWELPISLWDGLHTIGLRGHYVASVHAARIMVAQGSGLIVNVSSRGAQRYLFNVPYGVGKAGLDRLTVDTAQELRPHGVAVVSIWPGLTRTEIVMSHAERWPAGQGNSPHYVGRAVAALAADPEIIENSGRALPVADLAEEYGFVDPDDE